jgi:ABC-type multidrug transport system ATPase subunit
MKGMRKVYPGRSGSAPMFAVKNVTLAIEKGIVFGLLGPNGAGKTTLISILTGLYDATAGEANISGFDIHKERDQVYRVIGVCPQHDILWDDLTVEEHLLFYARLKGVKFRNEAKETKRLMDAVSLYPFRNRLSKGLSGGEKRRLAIAIALCGDPVVVFLGKLSVDSF